MKLCDVRHMVKKIVKENYEDSDDIFDADGGDFEFLRFYAD
tara:strand:+ start:672 stop:794 length:123 start_codon:yes stop_codon:yes gene_type:complete